MNDIPLPVLSGLLLASLFLSAFFSGSETGLMTINRYRLKTRADRGERPARIALALLDRPERLVAMLLFGKALANSLAAICTALVAIRLFPHAAGIAIGVLAIAVALLIFGEVTPKTLAALHPERIALPSVYVLQLLRWPLLPFTWLANAASAVLLKWFGVSADEAAQHSLRTEELRTVVAEAGTMIPQRHQRMLLSILELEKGTVEDIMIPRSEIVGIDLSEPWSAIRDEITNSQHTRIPVYQGSIDDLRGVVHLRDVVRLAANGELGPEALVRLAREPYFIPEGTPLNQQLLNFQNQKRRSGFVVDEYGDIQGLVTLEDILAEIIGELTTDPAARIKDIHPDPDGAYRVAGSVSLRSLNRSLGWTLPTDGPKTVNGLVLEKLEQIPEAGGSLRIDNYLVEITETRANAVKAARIRRLATSKSRAA